MNIPPAFKYNQDVNYRTGGVFETTHQFSLVNQTIQVNKRGKFSVRFPNIWLKYKLPKVKEPEIYDDWLANQMQFWQNQLNFAIWISTTGCGISKNDHLRHKNPMLRSVFRFHTYYQTRRVLSEMQCPLPTDQAFNALNNGINMNAFEKICNEFGISVNTNFRQKLDHSNGMGSFFFYKKFFKYKFIVSDKWSELTDGGNYNQSMNWKIYIPADKFKGADKQTDKIEYIEQSFHKQSDTVDTASDGNPMSAIGSFVCDYGKGFTQAGVSRINDSIRTYVWVILGAQSQTRSSILGTGKAFDAQKQFLANVEDAINAEVDLPSSIERYQYTLQYARSKVDYVVGSGLYMIPSDMDLYIGTINGYNNLITIATDNLQLGRNDEVNDEQPIQEFESKSDFEILPIQEEPTESDFETPPIQEPNTQIQEPNTPPQELNTPPQAPLQEQLTHEDNKLLLTLGGVILGSAAIWTLK